jgi:hypothetical protein
MLLKLNKFYFIINRIELLVLNITIITKSTIIVMLSSDYFRDIAINCVDNHRILFDVLL